MLGIGVGDLAGRSTGPFPEHPDATRGFGWEYIQSETELTRSQLQHAVRNPEDVLWGNAGDLVIGDGQHPARGDYGLVIGDDPNGEGQIVLQLLGGMVVSAASTEAYDSPAHDGEVAPDEEIILDKEYYRDHIAPQEDHLSREEIRETIENPDNVYEGTNHRGKTVWVWEKRIGDTVYYVRAEDFTGGDNGHVNGIRVRSGYENDDPSKLDELKKVYDLIKIWP